MQQTYNEDTATNHTDALDNLGDLFEKAKDYAETRADLFKLRATRQASEIASNVAANAVFYALLGIALMIINIGLALLIGEWLGKSYYGFFILGAVYLIAGFIFKAMRKTIIEEPVANSIIQKIYNGNEVK